MYYIDKDENRRLAVEKLMPYYISFPQIAYSTDRVWDETKGTFVSTLNTQKDIGGTYARTNKQAYQYLYSPYAGDTKLDPKEYRYGIVEYHADRWQAFEELIWYILNSQFVDNAEGIWLENLAVNENVNLIYTNKAKDAFQYYETPVKDETRNMVLNGYNRGTVDPDYGRFGKYYSLSSYLAGNKILNISEDKLRRAVKAKIIQNNLKGTYSDFEEAVKLLYNTDFLTINEVYPLGVNLMLHGTNLEISSSGNHEQIKKLLPQATTLNHIYMDNYDFDVFDYNSNSSYGLGRYPIKLYPIYDSATGKVIDGNINNEYKAIYHAVNFDQDAETYAVNEIEDEDSLCLGLSLDITDNSIKDGTIISSKNEKIYVEDNTIKYTNDIFPHLNNDNVYTLTDKDKTKSYLPLSIKNGDNLALTPNLCCEGLTLEDDIKSFKDVVHNNYNWEIINKTVKKIKTTSYTTWILFEDGSLYGCGSNQYAQQGAGKDSFVSQVPDKSIKDTSIKNFTLRATNVKDVQATSVSTWYLTNDGKMFEAGLYPYRDMSFFSWGDFNYDFTQYLPDKTIKKMFVYVGRTWCIDNENKAYVIGANDNNRLGTGTFTSFKEVAFSDGHTNSVKDIVSTNNTSWIITTDNKLYGTGYNKYGQQGSGDTDTVTEFTLRAENVKHVYSDEARNGDTTWYIDLNGNVYGCGRNNYGQQSSGDTANVLNFTKVETINANKMCVNDYSTWIVNVDNELYGTGYNEYGQQGSGDKTNVLNFTYRASDVVDVYGASGYTIYYNSEYKYFRTYDKDKKRIFLQDDSYIYTDNMPFNLNSTNNWLLTDNNKILRKGSLNIGQFSNMSPIENFYTFTKNTLVGNIKEIKGEYDRTLILTNDNKLYISSSNTNNLFKLVSGNIKHFDLIRSTGESDDYGIWYYIKEDGSLYGSYSNYDTPVLWANNVKTVSIFEKDVWYIDNSNILYGKTFGNSELGLNDTFQQYATNVNYIAPSRNIIWYIDSSDNLYGMGDNMYGQQGSGDAEEYYIYEFTKRAEDVKQVYAFSNETWYIDNNNDLYGCGRNDYGHQGSGDTKDVYIFTKRASNVKRLFSNCKNINTWYIDNNNTLFGCGSNSHYNLGLNITTNTTTFTQIKTNVSDIIQTYDSNYGKSIILTTDGTVWGCGHNTYKENGTTLNKILVDSDDTTIKTWTQISDTSLNVSKIFARDDVIWFITDENDNYSLYGKGSNLHGQQGAGYPTSSLNCITEFTKRGNDVEDIILTFESAIFLTKNGEIYVSGITGSNFGMGGTNSLDEYTYLTTQLTHINTTPSLNDFGDYTYYYLISTNDNGEATHYYTTQYGSSSVMFDCLESNNDKNILINYNNPDEINYYNTSVKQNIYSYGKNHSYSKYLYLDGYSNDTSEDAHAGIRYSLTQYNNNKGGFIDNPNYISGNYDSLNISFDFCLPNKLKADTTAVGGKIVSIGNIAENIFTSVISLDLQIDTNGECDIFLQYPSSNGIKYLQLFKNIYPNGEKTFEFNTMYTTGLTINSDGTFKISLFNDYKEIGSTNIIDMAQIKDFEHLVIGGDGWTSNPQNGYSLYALALDENQNPNNNV